ncbi:MAG: PKD domain-containing protein [Dehalococcoidales bacterium]|nr:PKD domain-containing protein [Dehalococcoidales bacterium]
MDIKHKVGIFTLALALTISVAGTSCTTSGTESTQAPEHSIKLGAEVELTTQTIGPSGGTIVVDKPGDPLDGMKLDVPAGAYSDSRSFEISYAPITGHDFNQYFNPISPMITVENGGDYSEELMTVTIPVTIPNESFAMAFYFDAATGKLEGIPLLDETPDSITIVTRHFSSFLVSLIDTIALPDEVDSGFRPGVDDWQFANRGSYIVPGGHCAGQAISAMWYYCEKHKKGEPHLYGLYDNNGGEKTPDLWQDDSHCYRLASTVQKLINWDSFEIQFMYHLVGVDDELTYKAFAYALLLTNEPANVGIYNTTVGGGHSMIVYRVANNTLYIADPNYPGNSDRKIGLVDGRFVPYNSGANAEAIAAGRGKAYDTIGYYAKGAILEWTKVTECWDKFYDGAIGESFFPEYNIKIKEADGNTVDYTEGFSTDSEAVRFPIESRVSGCTLDCYVWGNGVRLTPGDTGFRLSPGHNLFGIEIAGRTAIGWNYVDFVYIDIYKSDLSIEPSSLTGQPDESCTFTAKSDNLPVNARYEWDFGDGSPVEKVSTSQISHQFSELGNYTVSLEVYDAGSEELFGQATAHVSIEPESRNLLSVLQTFTTFRAGLQCTDVYDQWSATSGDSTTTNTWGWEIPWDGSEKRMDITWNGTSFSGTLLWGDPNRVGYIQELSGTVSPDGTIVESLVFSYRSRDEGTGDMKWVKNKTVNLEFTDLPLDWHQGQEDRQGELRCEFNDAEVASHVVGIEHNHEEVHTTAPDRDLSYSYVSTDWSQDARLFILFEK